MNDKWKRPRSGKKPSVFKSKKSLKQAAWKRSVASIAKSVALKQVETKHVVRSLGNAYLANQNVAFRVSDNLLYTTQGIKDGPVDSRLGDSVQLRGIKLYCSLGSLSNTPGVTYRILVLKVRKEYADQSSPPLKSIMNVGTMDPIDMEKCQKVYLDKLVTDRYMNTVIGLTAPPDSAEPIENTAIMMHRKFWIPLSGVYHYDDASASKGRDYNIACWVVAVQNRNRVDGTPIGSAGFSSQFYFKDP